MKNRTAIHKILMVMPFERYISAKQIRRKAMYLFDANELENCFKDRGSFDVYLYKIYQNGYLKRKKEKFSKQRFRWLYAITKKGKAKREAEYHKRTG